MGRRLWPRFGRQSGFTLIELLGVMVIVLLLSLVAVTIFIDVTGKVRQSASEGKIAEVEKAVERYQIDKGHYPYSLSDLVTANYIRSSGEHLVDPNYAAFTSPYYEDTAPKYFYYAVNDLRFPTRFVLVDPYVENCSPNDHSGVCGSLPTDEQEYDRDIATHLNQLSRGWRSSGEIPISSP